ncbi:hypothetical protein L2E82_12072 [Cichorium intybus]|uniref:Uncharacterized protein n=1 Tax=Cichorium intybus TaxID=13427 RepID=A0ACB9GF31_CICIN|nr:hypothetical protein L2E82_12072 [Cichorium intybus]
MRLPMRVVDLEGQEEITGREKGNHPQKPDSSSRRPHSLIQVLLPIGKLKLIPVKVLDMPKIESQKLEPKAVPFNFAPY